eukprot:Lithocolla_globosa_v1_NODE_1387_length_2613_cov_119.390387.p1 type:complete len:413 gc:universal NODE_1387_length_2613_cov_119.390387:1397-159(-)
MPGVLLASAQPAYPQPYVMPRNGLPLLKSQLLQQVEYYFGDINFPNDTFLMSQCDEQGWVPVVTIAGFFRIRKLTTDLNLIVAAMRESRELLEVSADGTHVRRAIPFMFPTDYPTPPMTPNGGSPEEHLMWSPPLPAGAIINPKIPDMVFFKQDRLSSMDGADMNGVIHLNGNNGMNGMRMNGVSDEETDSRPSSPKSGSEAKTKYDKSLEAGSDKADMKSANEGKVEGKSPEGKSKSEQNQRKLHKIKNSQFLKVEFKSGRCGSYCLDPEKRLTLSPGDLVLVEADRGMDLGKVVGPTATPDLVEKDVKCILRLAEAAEISLLAQKAQDEAKALALCQNKIKQKKLCMDVTEAEFQWDRKKLTYYFVADRRVDFRELVRELFKVYKTRLWMCSVEDRGTKQRSRSSSPDNE